MVTGAVSAAQNIIKCVRRCGLEVDDIILEQLASSHAVLTEDEKELGVCLVDIGGGTTDIAVFTEGSIRHTAVIPIAGDQVTNDIAVALRTPTQHAEEIKIKYACALTQLATADETIEVPGVGDRRPAASGAPDAGRSGRAALRGAVDAGAGGAAAQRIRGSDRRRRGAHRRQLASMEGLIELAEEVFHMPVRLGLPQHVTGLVDVVRNPIYATGVGLLLFGKQNRSERTTEVHLGKGVKGLWQRMKGWFQGNF